MKGISFAGILLSLFLIFQALHWAAYGDVILPGPVRGMWDKAWHNKVEPAKKEMEQKYKDTQTTAPQPHSYGLGDTSSYVVPCTVALCSAS